MMGYKKEVWFITGASTGFGLYLTKGLLQNGHRVAAVSRNKELLQGLLERPPETGQIQAAGGRMEAGCRPPEDLLCLTVDLASEDSVRDAIRQTILQFGRIDCVVNYAGYDLSTPVEELSESMIHQYFEENVFGTFHVLRQVLPYLRNQGSGIILNFSSAAAIAAAAGSMLHAATKLAIGSLSQALTATMEAQGIQQTFIGPAAAPQTSREVLFPTNACVETYYEKRTIQQPTSLV